MISRVFSRFSTKKSQFFWNDVNPCVLEAQYAVRGVVPTLAVQIRQEIQRGQTKYPFNNVTFCNIGNPQQFGQKPITFNREVLSCAINPSLIGNSSINPDASKRAQRYLNEIISVGSYSHSMGIPSVRQTVANYISRQDNVSAPSIDNIFLNEGASQGVNLFFEALITSPNDSVLVPIPLYPLFSASISLNNGQMSPYYLNEENGWQLDSDELERSIQQARKQGKNPKAMVIINPGNPTGSVFNTETLQNIIEFSVKNKLVLLSDEVYRENVYKQGATFMSVNRVINSMPAEYKNQCELVSLHSASKGFLGEAGLKGGYMHTHNVNPEVVAQLVKLKSINLCSNTIGQLMVDLMCNPPLQDVQQSTKTLYQRQSKAVYDSLKIKASLATQVLRGMKNISCNEIEGGINAFPQIKFSQKAIEAAEGQAPDLFYCLEVLKNTGIALVPGSGFSQKPGTHHFRMSTLLLPVKEFQHRLEDLKKFNDSFHQKYA